MTQRVARPSLLQRMGMRQEKRVAKKSMRRMKKKMERKKKRNRAAVVKKGRPRGSDRKLDNE